LIHFYKRTPYTMATKLCYNRGCGKEFRINENFADSCRFHPGAPYFHDAYKGWTCCQNKSTDFTTFLNTPGCTLGKHSNIKPVEPEKITGNLTKEDSPEVVEVRPPIQPALARPDFNSCPVTRLKPSVAQSARQALARMTPAAAVTNGHAGEGTAIAVGTACKNKGCTKTYSPETAGGECRYHPGVPVFHEGLKYWSCCQRKTTEFQQFMEQEGCEIGVCKWVEDTKTSTEVSCRYDWHQTASHVTVAIYAKKYDPDTSHVEVGRVRLRVHLSFPENKGTFSLDTELGGLVDVTEGACSAGMFGTKVEVKLKKGESGSWGKLEVPKAKVKPSAEEEAEKAKIAASESTVDALELDDLDLTPTKYTLSKDAQTNRY